MSCFPWGLSGIWPMDTRSTIGDTAHQELYLRDTGALAPSGKCLLSKHDNLRSILSTRISQEWWCTSTGEEEAGGALGLVS